MQIFSSLTSTQFYLKISKCLFLQSFIDYLDHIISHNGVAPELTKIDVMVNWPVPTTIKQLHWLSSLTGFYKHFIKHYASISFDLTELVKRDAFKWVSKAQKALNNLNQQ